MQSNATSTLTLTNGHNDFDLFINTQVVVGCWDQFWHNLEMVLENFDEYFIKEKLNLKSNFIWLHQSPQL